MTNPLLAPSTLPFALPDYAVLTDEHVREAVAAGMAQQLEALAVLAADPAPATVENVLHAWERSGLLLGRAYSAFWVARSADTSPERDALTAELSPRLAAHSDAIMLDRGLYDRLVALRERADAGEVALDEQDEHVLSRRLQDYRRSGIDLSDDAQERLRAINAELATLSTAFDTALTAGRAAAAVHVTDEAELEGLGEDDRAGLREAAAARSLEGWLVPVVNTSGQPLLGSLAHRGLRERLYRASVDRGLSGEHDTRETLVRVARLRAERAELLGYPHHAAYVHEVSCAGSTDAVNDILGRLTPGVVELTDREADRLADHLAGTDPGATLEPWDWQYLATRVSASGADGFDTERLKPYLEFERVLQEGVFAAATALYGLTFVERPELVGYTEEARVFEVREEDGSVLGAVVLDPWTRPTKKGGAWMTSLVDQSHLLGDQPVVTNTCNVPPPAPGSPSLMTWDNVITLFHEFGHDLHGLLSDVRYPSRSGTSVPRDFVEFPSQVNEIWAWEPSLLTAYARHHATGEPVPADWVESLVANRQESGRDTLELLAAMLLDQAWHQTPLEELPQDGSGVEAFEAAALERAGAAHPLVPPRYRSAYFHHIFGGGYAAGYYSYLWSEVMDADTVAWFREQGTPDQPGGMTRAAGEHFRRELLGRGGSIEALETYRRFRGRDPEVSHLLARLGLG
ncbi:M3 family metallopeptidase [Ornithinimicrobium cerasi]|uniref:Peptidyl-dipeptidase Dcp n=1 Tax=Ornithinimicrobium cerasi TaxID=2248773 RepID=A0A285VRD8_9MICO|nr:M3 family metallopeptidase [Ornithinimicrobium cerasi]SOC56615.1 peptidyl-dipeptidase Dcp [Ornithinimicrobium cerasi]